MKRGASGISLILNRVKTSLNQPKKVTFIESMTIQVTTNSEVPKLQKLDYEKQLEKSAMQLCALTLDDETVFAEMMNQLDSPPFEEEEDVGIPPDLAFLLKNDSEIIEEELEIMAPVMALSKKKTTIEH